MKNSITSFHQLDAWQQAHRLRLAVFKETQKFKPLHRLGLTSQIERASLSVATNIAEGFGRRTSKEKLQFYNIARGSLIETQDLLVFARDINELDKESFDILARQAIICLKILNGLMRSTRLRASSSKLPATVKKQSI